MILLRNFLTLLLLNLSLHACTLKDSSEIIQLEKADLSLLKNFNIKFKGDPKYQFYEKYGFTDIEEHLILILEKPSNLELQKELPLDSIILKDLSKIQTQKFLGEFWKELDKQKEFFSDIRLEAKEYFTIRFDLNFRNGTYEIRKQDGVEILIIHDAESKLLFIEVKKEH